jgi:hypothetical protein
MMLIHEEFVGNEKIISILFTQEVVDEDGKTKYQIFRLPSLSRPSLYHEVSSYLV